VSAASSHRLSVVYTVYIPYGSVVAIVIAPAMSQQASGNVGSINYTRWRGINVARTTYVYSDPNTEKQQLQRGKLEYLARAWGVLLNAANRETWRESAVDQVFKNRLGGEYRPSGYQLFMKWNLQLAVIGDLHNANAPTGIWNVEIYSLDVLSPPVLIKIWIKLANRAGDNVDCRAAIIFKAGPYTSGGRRPIEPEYRLLVVQKPPATYTDWDLQADNYYWYKAFGVLDSGQRTNSFESQVYRP